MSEPLFEAYKTYENTMYKSCDSKNKNLIGTRDGATNAIIKCYETFTKCHTKCRSTYTSSVSDYAQYYSQCSRKCGLENLK